MNWVVTLIDSNDDEYIVDEPVGFDGINFVFNKSMVHHGIFNHVATEGFRWIKSAYDLLMAEYNIKGADGSMECLFEYECNGTYIEYFRGKFDFNTFKKQCSVYCFVECEITASKCVDIFTSRMGQDVDIQATTNFDGEAITPLTLQTLTIEGQDILLQNKAFNTSGSLFNISGSYATTGQKVFYIPVYLPNNPMIEFGDFNINNVDQFIVETPAFDSVLPPTDMADWLAYGSNLVNWARTTDPLNCIDNDATIEWRSKGGYEINTNFNGSVTVTLVMSKYDENTNSYVVMSSNPTGGGSMVVTAGVPIIETFDLSFSTTPAYEESQYLLYFWAVVFQVNTGSPSNFTLDLSYDAGNANNYYTMTLNSDCDPSTCTSVALPDLLEFLPTAYLPEGCPTLEVEEGLRTCLDYYQITKGSFIRNVIEPSTPKLFTSFQYLFENINKIFNIGWGFDQNDTVIKVANVEDFYQSTIVANVGVLDKVTFTTALDLICGSVAIGYNKWEAEEYNGLDETNTERYFRRNINSNQNQKDLLSDIIGAGYTIEITRRKNQTKTGTSDWRYDDDLFIINSVLSDGTLYAYRGTSDAANLYSPSTRMNLRITPARNMMRWFRSISAANPTIANDQLIFTKGTGNYIAQSRFADQCFIETGVVTENQTIISTDVVDDEPIWKPIYANFNAPLSMVQFEAVKANPYGGIQFSCFNTNYVGFIVELNHSPNNNGMASFKLLLRP